jgi:hypothetical protein
MLFSEDESPEQVSRTTSHAQKNEERKRRLAFEDAERATRTTKKQKRRHAVVEAGRSQKGTKTDHITPRVAEDVIEESDEGGDGDVDQDALARMERAMQEAEDEESDASEEPGSEGGRDVRSSEDSEDGLDVEDGGSEGESTDADLDEPDLPAPPYLPDHLFKAALESARPSEQVKITRSHASKLLLRQKGKKKTRKQKVAMPTT